MAGHAPTTNNNETELICKNRLELYLELAQEAGRFGDDPVYDWRKRRARNLVLSAPSIKNIPSAASAAANRAFKLPTVIV
jgi:hypothetical protein